MKNLKELFCLVLLAVFAFTSFDSWSDSIFGTRVPHIEVDANLCKISNFKQDALELEIEDELEKFNKISVVDSDPQYTARIAKQIIGVASCFQIDPLVFSGLIGHESYFYNNSVSSSGAIGLGQLTSISLEEIAQQLHASSVPKDKRGTADALRYFNESLTCISRSLNKNKELKHWWNFSGSERTDELKKNTLLNLTYSAIIFKISFSKAISYINKQNKNSKDINLIIQKTLNFYNASSKTQMINHYKKTRKVMNNLLENLDLVKNKCYKA